MPSKLSDNMTLRQRLRHETTMAHEALDTRLSKLELTKVGGLSVFLEAQSMALGALEKMSEQARTSETIRILHRAADADLNSLGVNPTQNPPSLAARPEPLAIDYIVAGSRLGTAVLRKRWAEATDPTVKNASSYFTAPVFIETWREFCQTADSLPGDCASSDRIVADANALFDFFEACALRAMTRTDA